MNKKIDNKLLKGKDDDEDLRVTQVRRNVIHDTKKIRIVIQRLKRKQKYQTIRLLVIYNIHVIHEMI